MKISRLIILVLTILISTASFAPRASAQTSTTAATSTSAENVASELSAATQSADLSFQWMAHLFPATIEFWVLEPSGSSSTGTTTDVLEPLFQIFNSILFAIGAGMMCWHTVVGMVATAHQGKVLGDRWHTIWAPLRVIWGVGNLAPVKGYCMAQILVINLLLAGYSLANLVWNGYVDEFTSNSPTGAMIVPPAVDATQSFAAEVLQAETCYAVISGYQQASQGSWNPSNSLSGRPTVPASAPSVLGALTSDQSAVVWDYGPVCGVLKMPLSQESALALTQANNSSSSQPNLSTEFTAYQTFDAARYAAVSAFISQVRSGGLPAFLASGVTCCSTSTTPSSGQANTQQAFADVQAVMAAAGTMNNSIATAAQQLSTSMAGAATAEFRSSAESLGWASAGAMNYTIARMSTQVTDHVTGALPVAESVNPAALSSDQTSEAVIALNSAMAKLSVLITNQKDTAAISNSALELGGDSSSDPVTKVLKPLSDNISTDLTKSLSLNTVAPMTSMMELGNDVLSDSWKAIGIYTAARVAAAAGADVLTVLGTKVAAAIPDGIREGLKAAGGFIMMNIGIVMAFGALNAYILPMVTYFIWTFAVLGCACYAIEVVVAAPIAAFMHIRFDGQEFVNQEQKTIYSIIFNAFLRPTVLLFGLIASNMIFAVMAGYVNGTFSVAMIASQGDNMIGIVGIFVMLGMLMYLHYQLAVRSAALIHEVPRMVSHILGAQDGERGESTHGAQVFAGIANVSRSAGAGLPGLLKKAGDKGGQKPAKPGSGIVKNMSDSGPEA
jgi:conjugal transfer/type IV secretion protein DotA/TraY